MDKSTLDAILQEYKAQPVGYGYIDIIVSRDNYKAFIAALVENDFRIKSISWWEWCPKGMEPKYGYGELASNYFDGSFAELVEDVDYLDYDVALEKEVTTRYILDIVENKTISFGSEVVSFGSSNWLLPAVWLHVPHHWRNELNSNY